VPLGPATYDIVVGTSLLAHLPELLARYCPAPHYGIVTDATVGPLYAEPAVQALAPHTRVTVATFPAGEPNKTRAVWSDLTDRLLTAELGRDGAIVALGGGVVGDLAGFVAATYLRGIPSVQVPTTLLAMIDSSIGGKTGVDTPAGKNLVGAFHQPRAVIADIATLATLPRNHRLAGMAEAIKHGAVADRDYFERLRTLAPAVLLGTGDPDALREIVERSVAIKAAIVAEDELEHGRRAALNFGHTIGHAVEAVTGYELLHGEAVACGMALEAQLGRALGITEPAAVEAIVETLTAYQLPTSLPQRADAAALLDAMRHDKKVRAASVRFALIETLGKMHRDATGAWTTSVDKNLLRRVLDARDG
jgi:3-dehydroquinate synthase